MNMIIQEEVEVKIRARNLPMLVSIQNGEILGQIVEGNVESLQLSVSTLLQMGMVYFGTLMTWGLFIPS